MIRITNLSKSFRVYRGKKARLRALAGLARAGRDFDWVHSLQNLNLEVPEGTVHGIVGMNGAGKSTLLKILAGVLEPSQGSFTLTGRVAALLELGTGFHPDMTGRQNVETNAGLMGFTPDQVQAKMSEIEDFAELGAFFDRPVRIYSSGMYVRLAFAFAIAVEPQVLIIDEALSVGDAYFQQKCLEEINRFKTSGTTILFVSHDLAAIKLLCDKVSLLAQGQLIYSGSPQEALERYNALLAEQTENHQESLANLESRQRRGQAQITANGIQSGSGDMLITEVKVLAENGTEAEAFQAGSMITIAITTQVQAATISNPTCGILIRDRLGYDVFGTNSSHLNHQTGTLVKGQTTRFRFRMKLDLGQGDYTLTVALHSATTHLKDNYDWRDRACLIKVVPNPEFISVGVARLYPQLTLDHSL